jgi:hypothetical protein
MNRNIGTAEFDNPHTTYAQTLYDEERGIERPGKIVVPVNLRTMLGGFASFRGTDLQNETVKRFRSIFEGAQIGGARACDPSIEPVDGGGVRQESASIIGADARRKYAAAKHALGSTDLKRLEFVVIGESGPTAYARWRTGNRRPNSRVVSKAMVEMRVIVLKLAKHWELAGSVKGRRAPAAWTDGSELKTPSQLLDGAA